MVAEIPQDGLPRGPTVETLNGVERLPDHDGLSRVEVEVWRWQEERKRLCVLDHEAIDERAPDLA